MSARLLVIGDVIDDIIVMPTSEMRINTDTDASIFKTLGGSAANVAAWAAHTGASVDFVGCVNSQDLERNDKNFLSFGVRAQLQTSARPTGSIVVLVEGENRTMLTDRGANQDLDLAAVTNHLESDSILYLSGYALLGKSHAQVESLVSAAHDRGVLVAIDPGSTGYIADYGVEAYRSLLKMADVLFPNLEESELLDVIGRVPLVVVTDGPRGATAHWDEGQELAVPGEQVDSVDPTGAGDAFCGAFLAALSRVERRERLESGVVANALQDGVRAGSAAVARVGARPEPRHP